jgi:hypothetical protein
MRKALLYLLAAALLVMWGAWILGFIQSARTRERARELGAKHETEVRAYEQRIRSRPPLSWPAEDGEACARYRQAAERVRDLREEMREGSQGLEELLAWPGATHPLPDSAESVLRAAEPVLDLVRLGARTSDSGILSDVRRGERTRDIGWRPLHAIPHVHTLLHARVVLELDRGRPAEAVDWIWTADRLAEDVLRGATGKDQLVGLILQGSSARLAAVLVGTGRLPGTQVARVEGWFRGRLDEPVLDWSMAEGQYLVVQADLLRAANGHWLHPVSSRTSWLDFREPGLAHAVACWERLRIRFPALREQHPAGDDPAFRAVASEITEGCDTPTEQVVTQTLAQHLLELLRHRDRLRELREMALLNVALFRYRQLSGSNPTALAEILPDGVRAETTRGPWEWQRAPQSSWPWISRGSQPEGLVSSRKQIEAMLEEALSLLKEATPTPD